MSYDICLRDPVTKQVILLETEHHMRGGTYNPDGTRRAHLNITYNYGRHFRRVLGKVGIRSIYGMTGAESMVLLKDAMAKLKDNADDNYWTPTEGNAKRALAGLLALAQMRPNGVWDRD